MILVFDTFLSNSSLYPNFKLDETLNLVRANSYTYRHQPKNLIFLYTLFSFKNYPWKNIYVNFNCEDIFSPNELKRQIKSEMPNASVTNLRSSTGSEFVRFFESISTSNDWVFFSPNNDHPYISPNIKDLDHLIAAAESAELKYQVNVSIYYSHFTESINMIQRNNYLYFYTGRTFKILEENEYCYTVSTNHQPLESMQIMRRLHLIRLFDSAKNNRAIRLESLSNYLDNTVVDYVIIIPKFECCRHYDGYLHTMNVIKHYLRPTLVPPLFIPDGFFESEIKIRDGYLGSKANSVSLNQSATNYSFADAVNGVDLKIGLNDIPDCWKSRVVSVDRNPEYVASHSQIIVNKLEIFNPWYSMKPLIPFIFIFRLIRISTYTYLRFFKRIFIKSKASH